MIQNMATAGPEGAGSGFIQTLVLEAELCDYGS